MKRNAVILSRLDMNLIISYSDISLMGIRLQFQGSVGSKLHQHDALWDLY